MLAENKRRAMQPQSLGLPPKSPCVLERRLSGHFGRARAVQTSDKPRCKAGNAWEFGTTTRRFGRLALLSDRGRNPCGVGGGQCGDALCRHFRRSTTRCQAILPDGDAIDRCSISMAELPRGCYLLLSQRRTTTPGASCHRRYRPIKAQTRFSLVHRLRITQIGGRLNTN